MNLIDRHWQPQSDPHSETLTWQRGESKSRFNTRIFTVKETEYTHPGTGKTSGFFQLESRDWVNIFALTPAGNLVVVKQYRFGNNEVTLETPGGFVEDGEDPADSGVRELQEETGYSGSEVIHLKTISPNPALNSNKMHFYLVLNAEARNAQNLDQDEHIITAEAPLAEFEHLVLEGKIQHAMVIIGFYFMQDYLKKNKIFYE